MIDTNYARPIQVYYEVSVNGVNSVRNRVFFTTVCIFANMTKLTPSSLVSRNRDHMNTGRVTYLDN